MKFMEYLVFIIIIYMYLSRVRFVKNARTPARTYARTHIHTTKSKSRILCSKYLDFFLKLYYLAFMF